MLGVERLVAWPSERERFEQRPSPAFLGHWLQEVVAAQVSLRLLWKQVPQKALPGRAGPLQLPVGPPWTKASCRSVWG